MFDWHWSLRSPSATAELFCYVLRHFRWLIAQRIGWFVLGLNDDKWHDVIVTVDLLTAQLIVDVSIASTRERRVMTLMTSVITSQAAESQNPVTSIISLGGVIPSKHKTICRILDSAKIITLSIRRLISCKQNEIFDNTKQWTRV